MDPLTCGSSTAVALVLALTCGPAAGQERAGGRPGEIEELIVTATFREADVQKTPISITAVSGEMLDARSQTNLAQITAQAPNVSLRPAGASSGSALVAFIRGIGQTDVNPAVEPGVGIYVDDVYYSTLTGNLLDLLDLDRVEVLRGPQGTLSGRNAIGGAVKLFTRKPDGNDDVNISVLKGDFNRTEIKGAGGFTLIPDKLYARIAGVAKSMDGYVTRYDYACQNHLPPPGTPGGLPTYTQAAGCELGTEGGQSYATGRFALRWHASEKFTLDFAASIVNDHSEAQPGVLVGAGDHAGSNFPWLSPNGPSFNPTDPFTCLGIEPWTGCAPNNPAFSPRATTQVPIFFDNNHNGTYEAGIDVPYDGRFATGGKYYNYATYVDDGKSTPSPFFQGGTPGANTNVFKPFALTPVNTLSSWDAAVNLNWKITDSLSLLSVSSYRTYSNSFAEDTDGSPLAVQQLLQVLNHEQWTEELRLNVTTKRADLTFGAFYLSQKTTVDARVDLPYIGLDFLHGPDPVPATNKAIYGNGALHLSDRTELSLGVRYSEDDKSYSFRRHDPDGTPIQACTTFWFWEAGNPANCNVFGLDGLSIPYTNHHTDWRVALSHLLGASTMIYVQASTGYKAGGNNPRPFFPSQSHAFKPETLDSYELGVKTTLGGNVRLNAAVFSAKYSDIQLPTSVCFWAPPDQQRPCLSLENIGDADEWGAEVEAEWHPADKLSIDASYGKLNFKYTRIEPVATVTPGSVPPYSPENQASFGLQYRLALGGAGSVTPRVDASYTSQVYSDVFNNNYLRIGAHTVTNLRVTWRSAEDQWQIALEGTNLTNNYYYVTVFDLSGVSAFVDAQPSRPREWAMTVKRTFK